MTARRVAIVLGASSDIGAVVSRRLAGDGWQVIGTYRTPAAAEPLEDVPGISLLRCDVSSPEDVGELAAEVTRRGIRWTLFVSAVGRLDPIGPWANLDFDTWERSVSDNSLGQLRVLHALLASSAPAGSHAAFFAGGGTNGPFTNYSAYCLAKIALIKMCELLHDEIADLNAFIVGPGFLPTKIHAQTIAARDAAAGNYAKTLDRLDRLDEALSADEVYECITWCMEQGRDVVGGRNIAVAYDPWRDGGTALAEGLRGSADMWRLRRSAPWAAR